MTGIKRVFVAGACLITLSAVVAAPGMASEGTDDQLIDVSKQVAGIHKKMDDLRAHGRWARRGELLEGADCGFDDPSRIFSPWGDLAMYALAPQGDLSPQ